MMELLMCIRTFLYYMKDAVSAFSLVLCLHSEMSISNLYSHTSIILD